MKKLASLIRENNDELAALEAGSMGRPVGEYIDARICAAKWDRYAEAGYNVQGKMDDRGKEAIAEVEQVLLAFRLRDSLT